jgi:hypothetical protein
MKPGPVAIPSHQMRRLIDLQEAGARVRTAAPARSVRPDPKSTLAARDPIRFVTFVGS